MMRGLKTLIAFAALAAGFLLLERVTAPGGSAPPAATSAAALSLADVLADRSGMAIAGIVISPSGDGERDFRGLHAVDGRLRPVYGRVRNTCGGQATDAACWEVAYLEIDGQPAADGTAPLDVPAGRPDAIVAEEIETADIGKPVIDVAPTAGRKPSAGDPPAGIAAPARPDPDAILPPPGATEGAAPEDLGPEGIVTGAVPVPASRGGLAMMDRPAPEPGSDEGPDPVHKPTHAVDRPIINVRDGPGTDKMVVARLPHGMRLSLIDKADDWGRFVVLDGAATGREVWAALRILKRLP